MNMKKIALVLAGAACIAGSTAMAADTMMIKSSNKDNVEEVMVYKSTEKGYYQYYNSAYGYVVDIPKEAVQADATIDGDGCYFQDPKDKAVFRTEAAKNPMGFSVDEWRSMYIGMNGSPALTTDIRTKTSYAIGWTAGKKSYYRELYVNDKDQTYTSFTVEYPTDKKDKYEKIIAHMACSFVPSGVKM